MNVVENLPVYGVHFYDVKVNVLLAYKYTCISWRRLLLLSSLNMLRLFF